MKRQYNVTMEVRKMIIVPVEAEDEEQAAYFAEIEVEHSWDEQQPEYREWFVYDIQEVN